MPAIRTILHPTDFSESSEAAFRLACSLARDYGATLVIVHVYPSPAPPEWTDYRPPGEVENALMTRLYELKPEDRETEVAYRLIAGKPADVILDVAEEVHADMIVLGTHGRTELRLFLLAFAVIPTSDCAGNAWPHGIAPDVDGEHRGEREPQRSLSGRNRPALCADSH